MRHLLLGFALTVLPPCAGQGLGLAPIALYTQFPEQPPAAVLESMQQEVQSIMAPAGLRFHWQDLATADGTQAVVELAIVNFRGRCDIAGMIARDSNPGALGWTNTSDGVILPFANVDCSGVRSFIQKELMERPPQARAISFGRALGRVLAHELYHIFANTLHHGSDGVARESYSVHDLLCGDFQLGERDSLALINSKAHAYLANAPSTISEELEHQY
jgi:hypothetical protein